MNESSQKVKPKHLDHLIVAVCNTGHKPQGTPKTHITPR